ncbi:MAG: hypothetical protein Q4G46_00660 [Propionibacteriaceae bacterium]|nr:hypothetical protein [Propionibacteriaceae bacterium]
MTETRRGGATQDGMEFAQVDFVACPGSRGARMWGPFVEGASISWQEVDKLGSTGSLVDRNTCIPVTIDVEVPAGKPTEITIGVQMEYAAGTREAVNNGMHYGSAIIR